MVQRTRALRGRSALAQILQELEAQQRRRRQRVGTGGISPAAAYAVTEAERRASEGPIIPPSPTAPEQIVPGEPKPNILQQAFGVVNAPFRAAQNIVAPVNRFMAKIIPGEQPIERGERPPTALESVLTGLGAVTSRLAAPVVGSIAQTATKLAGHEAESKRIAESMTVGNLLLRPESVLETVKESTKFPTGVMGALEIAAGFPVLGVGAKLAGVAKGAGTAPRIAQRAYKYAPEAVPTTEALLAKPADPGWIGATAEKLTNWHIGHVFPLRPFLRGVNPSLDMQGTTEGRALLLGNHLDDFADNTWAVISGRAREIHSRAFRFDSNDNVINAVVRRSGANPKPKIQQLLSMRGDYALSPEQRQFAALYDEIVNWTKAQEAAEGILIRERTLLPGETYIHRKVTSIRGQEVYGGARKGISGKQPFQRRLVYDMVDDAINAGVNFDKDMVASLEVVYKGGMINIRNARMARLLQAIPGARTTAVLGRVREAREKALLNWRNESRKLRQLRAVYPGKVAKAPVGAKEPWQMTRAEFDAAWKQAITHEKTIDTRIFGEAGAKRYNAAQRTTNSMFASPERQKAADKIIEEMEAALTEAQRNELFGIGEVGRSVEEWKAFRAAFEDISDFPAEDLIADVRRNLPKVRPDDMRNLQSGVGKVGDTEQIAAIKLRRAIEQLTARGMAADQIFQKAGQALADQVGADNARFLLQEWIAATKAPKGLPAGLAPSVAKAPKAAKELIDEAVDKVALARVAVTETKAAFKAKRAYLLEKHPGEGAIRGLGGWYFPEAVAKTVNAHFENQMPQLLKAIKTASSLSVSLGTTIDIGWSMNQGLPLLFNNTRAWAQSAVWSAREIAKPQAWGRFLSKPENYDAAMRAVTQGKVLLEDIGEMVEQAGATGLLTTAGPLGKIPVLGGAYKKTIGKAFERGGAGFTTAGNVARVLTYEALEPLALRRGAGALEDLGSFVNKMTGTLSTRALGAANKQRGVETMLLFAPRFTRAAFALAGDTLRGGLRGELARNSLAKLALGGTITYVVAAELLGQRPMLDMRPVSEGGDGGKAFTVEAFGQRIGWGGPFRMIAGVLFHATAAAATDPTALVKIDTSKNPFLKSLRGRVSPVLSATWDTTTGRNYIGEPTDFGSDPLQWTKEVLASRIVPFWAEAMLFDEPPSLMGGAIGISGLKNYPVSFWDRRTDLRNEIAQQQYGRPWDELLPDEQIRLERSSPDLKAATDIARKVSLERADETGVMIADYGNDAEDARERLLDKLNTAQREFEANGLGSRGTRESIADKIDDALAFYRQEWDRIEGKYPKVREYFDGLPQPEKQTVAHIAYAEYIATVLAEPTLIDQYGDYQYDRRQELEEAFRNKWGIEVYAAIQMRKKESQIDYPPIVQELLAGRENPVFRAYWEVDKILLERVGQAALYPLYQEYKQADSYMREQMQELYPVFKQIDSAVTQARRLMRERNANLDRYMFRFGKTGTVVHKDNIGREEMILDFG